MTRSENFPPYILLGDSIVENVRSDDCGIFSMPDAKLEEIGCVATFIANLPSKALILFGGTHNITDENGRYNMKYRPPQV
uniref:Uncharacterized protein n=1 Tax=Romanomermis culicivorax TaxID=13658 RepID=A0A915J966_ROMCU